MSDKKVEKMSMESFLRAFGALFKNGWEAMLDDGGWIRLKAPMGKKFCFCPLTAVCFQVQNKRVTQTEYFVAGRALGLKEDFVERIADAADNYLRSQLTKRSRARMLTISGLSR